MATTPLNIPPNVDAVVGYNFLNTVIDTAKPAPPPGTTEQLGDSSSECQISQNAVTECRLANITIVDCQNTTITCDSVTGQSAQALYCNLDNVVQQAWNKIMSMNLTPAQIQSLANIMATTGVPVSELSFQDAITAYLTQRCKGVENSEQSIYIPNITLHGPNCSDDTVFALNRLDQNAQCVLANMQQLLRLAGLDPNPAGPTVSPYSAIDLPRVTLFWMAIGLVVFLIIAVVIGGVIRTHRHKVST